MARQDFSPYGELMRSAGLPLTIGYTGHPWDRALGQYAAPFRYYNPATARWNMRDPLGFVGGLNQYAYQPGNPISYADPLGLICWSDALPLLGMTLLVGGLVATTIGLAGIPAGATILGIAAYKLALGGALSSAVLFALDAKPIGRVKERMRLTIHRRRLHRRNLEDLMDGVVEVPRHRIPPPPPVTPSSDCWTS